LFDALDENYISDETLNSTKQKGREVERLLNGYLVFLRKKRDENK
jgi:hypothetical protein